MRSDELYDDSERLRRESDESRRRETRPPGTAGGGAPSVVVKIASTPTHSSVFYTCTPQTVTGAETEGGAGTLTVDAGSIVAYNLGTAIPPSGTAVLITFADFRWVFRYDG